MEKHGSNGNNPKKSRSISTGEKIGRAFQWYNEVRQELADLGIKDDVPDWARGVSALRMLLVKKGVIESHEYTEELTRVMLAEIEMHKTLAREAKNAPSA